MKKGSIISVIINGFGAIFWTVRAVLDIINTTYVKSPISLVLVVVCTICWDIAFVVQLISYIRSKNRE